MTIPFEVGQMINLRVPLFFTADQSTFLWHLWQLQLQRAFLYFFAGLAKQANQFDIAKEAGKWGWKADKKFTEDLDKLSKIMLGNLPTTIAEVKTTWETSYKATLGMIEHILVKLEAGRPPEADKVIELYKAILSGFDAAIAKLRDNRLPIRQYAISTVAYFASIIFITGAQSIFIRAIIKHTEGYEAPPLPAIFDAYISIYHHFSEEAERAFREYKEGKIKLDELEKYANYEKLIKWLEGEIKAKKDTIYKKFKDYATAINKKIYPHAIKGLNPEQKKALIENLMLIQASTFMKMETEEMEARAVDVIGAYIETVGIDEGLRDALLASNYAQIISQILSIRDAFSAEKPAYPPKKAKPAGKQRRP